MKRLDDSTSCPMTVRLSIADRAALVGDIARLNEAIETNEWLELTARLNVSQIVRFALRTFWSDWQSCEHDIRSYFAARVTAKTSSWVAARLLFALLSNEESGFAWHAFSQSDKFSKDKSIRPLVYCGWMRDGSGYGVTTVLWGVASAPVGVAVSFDQLMHSRWLGTGCHFSSARELFMLLASDCPSQRCVFGTCP